MFIIHFWLVWWSRDTMLIAAFKYQFISALFVPKLKVYDSDKTKGIMAAE